MTTATDRRRPDRHQFVLRLLRRLAVLFLIAAVAVVVVPRALVEVGVLGLGPTEAVAGAERAVVAARSYGATPDLPALQGAERELASAQDLARRGEGREARRAAQRATFLAIEAQKLALVRKAETRTKAEVVYNDLDRQINDLEKLYASVTPGLEKERISQLLSVMKVTRQSAGLVFLAYEQQDYARVLEGEPRARAAIASARETLKAQRR